MRMELGEPIEGDMIQARVYVCGHRLHRAWNMPEACLGEKGKERCDWQTEMGERKKCITSRPLDRMESCLGDVSLGWLLWELGICYTANVLEDS